MNEIVYIKGEYLYHHPQNPRKDLGDLTELTESIRKNGIMQNLTVVPDVKRANETGWPAYLVVIGNRRLEAGKAAGLEEFPCVVAEMSEREQLSTMLEENMQRADLTYYEQAQGFQLMLDLGETVASIAAKSGFTQKTVRQRLEMAKLDPDQLKEACAKQISLADLDELTKIHDVALRNKALAHIGENDYAYTIEKLSRKEKVDVELPFVREKLNELKAKRLEWSQQWSGKYERYLEMKITTAIDRKDEDWIYRPGEKVFYVLEEDSDQLLLLHETEKAHQKKKSKAEIDREQYVEESWLKILQMAKDFHALRKNFIFDQRLTAKNTDLVLDAAVEQIVCAHFNYGMSAPFCYLREEVKGGEALSSVDVGSRILEMVAKDRAKLMPRLVWESMGDMETMTCTGYVGRKSFPTYSKNHYLEMIYRYLCSLGYVMCDEEKQMLDGSHPVYKDKDAKEGK